MCHTLFCQALPNVNSVNPHNPSDDTVTIYHPFFTDLKIEAPKRSYSFQIVSLGLEPGIWRPEYLLLHAKMQCPLLDTHNPVKLYTYYKISLR